jgi:hypothetical protein
LAIVGISKMPGISTSLSGFVNVPVLADNPDGGHAFRKVSNTFKRGFDYKLSLFVDEAPLPILVNGIEVLVCLTSYIGGWCGTSPKNK